MSEPFVLFGFQRHHLDGQVVEVWPAYTQGGLEVFHPGHTRVLAGDEQQIFEWTEFADGLAFFFNLLRRQYDAVEFVVAVEAAVYARVGAGIRDVHRDVHRNCFSEAFLCVMTAQRGHLLQIGDGSRRHESHEIIVGERLLAQSSLDVGSCFAHYPGSGLFPVIFL